MLALHRLRAPASSASARPWRPAILDHLTNDPIEAWARVRAALPEGWVLKGLRCASTGLDPDQRSDDWMTLAVGPGGAERQAQAPQPIEALEALAQQLSTERRSAPG